MKAKITSRIYLIALFCIIAVFTTIIFTGCPRAEAEEGTGEPVSSSVETYDLLTVTQYIAPHHTSSYGDISSFRAEYYFAYLDDEGNFQEVCGFEHNPMKSEEICIGETNKYVIVVNGPQVNKYLYLTKDTIANMGHSNNN